MLRIQVSFLVSSLTGVADAVEERDSLRLEVVELREQLGVKTSVLEQVEAEFSALTNSARLVVEDRDRLREKNEELQASVNRLTNMLWGRRSEKRSDPNHPTLFDLQLTADELAAERQWMMAAEMQLDAASQQQALDDLLTRRKRKKLERLGRGGREQFPAHQDPHRATRKWPQAITIVA